MDIPIVVTEQYPEGLGSTIQGLLKVSDAPSKTYFSDGETQIRARIETSIELNGSSSEWRPTFAYFRRSEI